MKICYNLNFWREEKALGIATLNFEGHLPMIQPWIHCSRSSCRPLRRPWLKRLSRGGRFRKLLETYMLSNCGWLIKEKKRRRRELWIPVTFIVDACASKCVHAQQIYIIRQEFALPPSSSFPNISNLYSIVETSDIWHLHPQRGAFDNHGTHASLLCFYAFRNFPMRNASSVYPMKNIRNWIDVFFHSSKLLSRLLVNKRKKKEED